MLGQDDNERLLGAKLRSWHAGIEWNTELIGLDQTTTHVVATLRDSNGKERRLTADYVAGCDGVHSTENRIGFRAPYEHVFIGAIGVTERPTLSDSGDRQSLPR